MKRKQRAAAAASADAPQAPPATAAAMSPLRLRAIEHGVEESDLASVSALGEVLPLVARLKDGQVRLAGQVLFRECFARSHVFDTATVSHQPIPT